MSRRLCRPRHLHRRRRGPCLKITMNHYRLAGQWMILMIMTHLDLSVIHTNRTIGNVDFDNFHLFVFCY